MKHWKIPISIAAGIVVVSVIAIVLFYSIPVNPCMLFPFQSVNALLATTTTKELYDGSELVVIGRIGDSTVKCEGSRIWTYMQIEVEDSAKNPQGIKFLTGKSLGGKIWNYGHWVEDSQIFEKGDRAFLYLYKDNPSDTVYRISPYSGALAVNGLPDEAISAKEILKSFRLHSVTTQDGLVIDVKRGNSKDITLDLESFFGYSSATNLTISSFTHYDDNKSESFNTANVTVLKEFGLSIEPVYVVITPPANGSTQVRFLITASEEAVRGLYDIFVTSAKEDRYSYLAGGVLETYVRVNVTDQNGGNISPSSPANNATVIISKGIDDIDSGVTFNPPIIRTVLGINNTVTWVNTNATSIPLESNKGYFNVTIEPGRSFSFTFDSTGKHEYYVKTAGKSGTVIVSTKEMEDKKLVPSAVLTKSPEEIAKTIATAIIPEDNLAGMRLNNTRVAAFPTEKGADIIISKVPEYLGIEYWNFNSSVLPSFSDQQAMNFTTQFMEKIGYTMDGSEWVDPVNFGDVIDITINQRPEGWIISDEGAHFRYYPDHAWITIGRWYNDISSYEFGLSSDDAKVVAKKFMDSEVKKSPILQKYAYAADSVNYARVEIIDDKVMYVVSIGYGTTNPSYYDDRGHCGEPASRGFDVLVDASTGSSFDWRYSMCE